MPISSPNPMIYQWLELSHQNHSNKWSDIGFGREMKQVESIEVIPYPADREMVPHPNSLDPDETPTNSASQTDPRCRTIEQSNNIFTI